VQVKALVDKKVIEATDKLGHQLLASIALHTDATIGEVRHAGLVDASMSLVASAFAMATKVALQG
jgi:hypothetical protein